MTTGSRTASVRERFAARNAASAAFFEEDAVRLAELSSAAADRFARGGRLFAIGAGAAATDAQHVAVEFAHPVLVGKRALPAVHLRECPAAQLRALAAAEDIVLTFGAPDDSRELARALREAGERGVLRIALGGGEADYTARTVSDDPFIQQELIEVVYHTLWETVHVFMERQPIESHAGGASFLYPFLGKGTPPSRDIIGDGAASIRAKAVAVDGLRASVAETCADEIVQTAAAMCARVEAGATVFCFGNGGSATDADDLALDLAAPPKRLRPVRALSLSSEAATLTAIANDIGREAIFARQLMAHGRPGDVAVAISTSGGSSSIIAGLSEARARGLLTVALLGYDGGEVSRRGLADRTLVVDSDQIPRIQEVHASIYHVIVDLLDELRRDR